jgi:addiction module HigA family antidote
MHSPPHPGENLKQLIFEHNLTITETAKALDVSRKHLSDIVNGHFGISPEMAMRLSIAFSTTAEFWLHLQMAYDLWHVEQKAKKLKVQKLAA